MQPAKFQVNLNGDGTFKSLKTDESKQDMLQIIKAWASLLQVKNGGGETSYVSEKEVNFLTLVKEQLTQVKLIWNVYKFLNSKLFFVSKHFTENVTFNTLSPQKPFTNRLSMPEIVKNDQLRYEMIGVVGTVT